MFTSTSVLQFDELKNLLAQYAGSEAGRARIHELEPHRDRALLESELAEAGEGIAYGRDSAAVRLRFSHLPEISASLRFLSIEGVSLEGRGILDLFQTLTVSAEYRQLLTAATDRYPRLARKATTLADLRSLIRQYERAFLPDGSLSDDASVALRQIRREIERQRRGIQDSLDRFLRAHRSDGVVQENFVTVRDDRYVVPIVAGQKGRIDGVIHGSSGTGRTLFVEPLDTIELNNQLVRLREDELREIQRILAEITNVLREHREEIQQTATILADLDVIFAKAEFARSFDAVIPRFSDPSRRLVLRDARHPLLEAILRKQRKPIVPISFELSETVRCLLISGPNTGGKTVAMKTTGLLALMAHAAIPVPAAEAEFPLFDDVLADIGDQQSIAESLSSFSGHLLQVKQMLELATAHSLVLLDELGRATDPEEGGALGVAILDEFRKSGAFCLASTHLLPLKLYGTSTEGVLNASMGFDEETLQPTYRLKLGLPGKSAGLAIATRLELPQPLLDHARAVLPRLQANFEQLISDLHTQVEQHRQAEAELQTATADLKRRQAELEQDAARREQRRQREWANREEHLIADFEARAQALMSDIAGNLEQRKALEQAQRQIAKTRREFREEAAEVMAPTVPTMATQEPQKVIREGSRVRLRDVREPATVRRLLKNGILEVEAGFLKMQVAREDVVEVLDEKTVERDKLKNVRIEVGPSWDVSYRELNVIGQRSEEAAENVDKFLDSAALASVDRVRIIHGHGMGVLKKTIGELLGRNPHVSRFYPASQSEGGSGATIVELRA
jgi:DNA mismatch repair protein MutS2